MLELVEVDVAVGQRRVRLRVVGEVDDLDGDALVGGGLGVVGPVRVAGADDADLHGLVGIAAAGAGGVARRGAAGESGEQGQGGESGEDLGGLLRDGHNYLSLCVPERPVTFVDHGV